MTGRDFNKKLTVALELQTDQCPVVCTCLIMLLSARNGQ